MPGLQLLSCLKETNRGSKINNPPPRLWLGKLSNEIANDIAKKKICMINWSKQQMLLRYYVVVGQFLKHNTTLRNKFLKQN